MKRDIDQCFQCERMMRCDQGEQTIGHCCLCPHEKPSVRIMFVEGEMALFAGDSDATAIVDEEHWNELDVPDDCDCYEQYFLKECNK